MKKILTITGPIAPEELGFTSMHEHVMIDIAGVLRKRLAGQPMSQDQEYSENDPLSLENVGLVKQNLIKNWDDMLIDDEEMMLGEVEEFKKSGGQAMLEVSVPGIRTKVPAIKRIAEKSGVHIIVSTGLYTSDSWPDKYLSMSDNELRNYMLDEIKNGIEDTGIKPGHLKIAVEQLTDHEERALRAAARVANETGLSLTIHSSAMSVGGSGLRVARILKEEEMDLSRAVIAHTGGSLFVRDLREAVLHPETIKLSLDYTSALMDYGVNASLEFLGPVGSSAPNRLNVPDWVVIAGVYGLLKKGYSHQIVLGTDTCRKVMTRRGGGDGYCRLTNFAIPKLKEFGVSDYDIRTMMVSNPARILAF